MQYVYTVPLCAVIISDYQVGTVVVLVIGSKRVQCLSHMHAPQYELKDIPG